MLASGWRRRCRPGWTSPTSSTAGSEAERPGRADGPRLQRNTDVVAVRNGYHGGSPSTMALTSLHTWKSRSKPTSASTTRSIPIRTQSVRRTAEQVASKSPRTSVTSSATRRQAPSPPSSPSRSRVSAARRRAPQLPARPTPSRASTAALHRRRGADRVGRTGERYWGFQNSGRVADIVTMAKGIRQRLAARRRHHATGDHRVDRPSGSTSTPWRQPRVDAAGLAVLDISRRWSAGERPRRRRAAQGRASGAADVTPHRRRPRDGLMLGAELVHDARPRSPRRRRLWRCGRRCARWRAGGKGGLFGNNAAHQAPDVRHRGGRGFYARVMDEALKEGGKVKGEREKGRKGKGGKQGRWPRGQLVP